jgi:hypothetical protein
VLLVPKLQLGNAIVFRSFASPAPQFIGAVTASARSASRSEASQITGVRKLELGHERKSTASERRPYLVLLRFLNVGVDLLFENLEGHCAIPQNHIVEFALIEFRSQLGLRALP